MAEELLELPVLGQPFELGTLYNANKNQIVPSLPLWDRTNINVIVSPRSSHETNITTTDSLVSKMHSLDIKGNLVISALSNKLEVKGYGAFLNDKISSKTEAKIQLETKGTKEYHTISKNHFSKANLEQYHEFIEKSGATHVVVGITYGYQVFLILETTCESEIEKMNVEGKLIFKIMSPVQGEVQGLNETNEEKSLNALKVKIHGNVRIPSNPTSLIEAIEIYKRIPELVTSNGCPMTVHLLPLASVCSSLPKACSQINEAVLNSVIAIFEDIRESEMALRGIKTSEIALTEPRIRQKAKKVSAMLTRHKIWLQMKLNEIISNPTMDMDTDSSKSKQIQNVMKKHQNSPFSTECFGIYLFKMGKEECFLKNLTKMLTFNKDDESNGNAIEMNAGEGERNRISIDILSDAADCMIPFERCKVFELEIPIITEKDGLLKEMEKYDPDNDIELVPCKVESWPFEDKTIQQKILKCAKNFVKLALTHQNGDNDKRSTKFRCVFTGFEIGREPTINAYNASTGDIEPYYSTSHITYE